MPNKLKHLPYKDAPDQLRALIDEVRRNGEQIVFEDENHTPVACLTMLPDPDHERRAAAARRLRELMDSVPPSPYSEEETYRLIDEAIAAVRKELREQSVR